MSIQRWAEGFRGGGVRATDGEWVKYDDHLAALRACEERVTDRAVRLLKKIGLEVEQEREDYGYRPHKEYRKEVWVRFRDALAAIDALKGEQA